MSAFALDWLQAIWIILVESGPYLLVGFLIAGMLKVLIPEQLIYRHLGKDNLRSVFLASLFGVPIPLCSCSVIPTAISLKRSGASKGATTSFLISTPETGVDSIGVTWALMDPIMTIMRPLSALFTAFFSGALVNRIVNKGWDDQPDEKDAPKLEDSCCHSDEPEPEDHSACSSEIPSADSAASCHAEEVEVDSCCHDHEPAPKGKFNPIDASSRAVRYAYGTLMADLTPWFILGFAVAGLITLAVPDDFFGNTLPNGWMSMVAMLFIGAPLYICATASTPVAAAMLAKGLDPGAALVLLLAGPATNIATIAVVRGFLGKRVLWAYLGSIAVFSLLFGVIVNVIYDWLGTTPQTAVQSMEGADLSTFSQFAGLILLAMLVYHSNKLGLVRSWGGKLRHLFLPLGLDLGSRPMKFIGVLLLLSLYLSTGWTSVQPGQTGFQISFGRLVRTIEEPGLVLHAPYPFAAVEIVSNEQLRSESIVGPVKGLPVTATSSATRLELEAATEVLTLDESLLKCTYAVHYQVSDSTPFHFRVEDPAQIVRGFAEASLREVILQMTADQLLIGRREETQDRIRSAMQTQLDALQCGVKISSVHLDEVHASSDSEVHYAFRDVASALEDKQRYVHQGHEYQIRREAEARAMAYTLEQTAAADADAVLQAARGESAAFLELREALIINPMANRLRLQLQTLEKLLAGKKLVLVLDPGRNVVPLPTTSGTTAPLFDNSQPTLGQENN